MSRRVKEKNQILREYFYKFYRAGIFSKMRSVRKVTNTYMMRNSLQGNININNKEDSKKEEEDISLLFFKEKSKSVMVQHDEEIKELKIKRKKILESIIYKTDRDNVKILKNMFEKYYLRSKVLSFGTDVCVKKKKKKKKKIGKKKSKNVIEDKEQEEEKSEKNEEENNEEKNE